ncbi:MAG TPA: POTRA domain-containing protein, partial [Candidatus Sulfomarinibacteraceae bacterium]|nr:POTRA domain-containing protein [Candidatus Sulfomarinibacteraceae bacterium]
LRARGPLRLQYRDGTVAVQPFELEGEVSSAQGEAQLELGGGAGRASAELVIGPSWLRLMPIDLDATGAVEARLRFGGLPSAPGVRIELKQRDGDLLMRDPPVRITNLEAEVELADGVWSIPDGSADVNRGRVLLGGEWNVETGQGVIFGLEDVSFLLPEGILTRWDGAVVVEPAAGRAARVIGELMMNGGLWHQEVDLQAALFGDEVETGTTAELMYDVVVDVEVYGRGALEVENNLGDFEITWHVLDIGGTLAEPLIQGELTLVPGGVITLTGAAVEIARGTIRFTGEPGAAPEVEVIPARDAFALGGEGGAGFDADLLLRRGVAGSLGSALGLRNKSLAPATIAVETLSDPSTNYLISRQIGRYVALFVAADLTDVQERTMLLQISNWRRIPGLAVQGIDDSRTGAGLAVIERLSWGGTFSERPRIRRVRFEGDWPLGRRRLKRALQLESGQLYDPFLVFVGRVRLERELARAGYYQARVNGTVSEDPKLPGLSFTVEPGPRREVVFDGGDLPAKVRRDVTARYRPPPARQQGFAEMRRVVRDYLDAVHHPYATVEVAQEGEAVAVRIDRGTEVVFEGPSAAGVADDAEQTLQRLRGSAAELAELARERPEALRRAERLLSLEGYVEPRIRRVRLEKLTQDRTRIHLEVEHGGRSAVGEVVVSGRDPLQVVEDGELPITAGMPARRGTLAAVERMLRDVYRDEGYTEVEVEGRFVGEGELRDVVLEIDPGRQHRVAEVRIAGRRHISESLLRKGIVLEEGDLVRPRTINRSIVQLAGFAPIARVDVETEDAGPGEVDFDIHITERARWTVGAGARWSADTGLLGLFDLRDDGLFQRGFSLNLRGLVGSERNALALIGSLPRPPGGRWSSSLTLSYRDVPSTTEPDRVQEESRSASVEATVRLRES